MTGLGHEIEVIVYKIYTVHRNSHNYGLYYIESHDEILILPLFVIDEDEDINRLSYYSRFLESHHIIIIELLHQFGSSSQFVQLTFAHTQDIRHTHRHN